MLTKDMTKGNALELIVVFAIPLFIGTIFQQLYAVADTAVLGHALGDEAIAAVGATSSLFGLLINVAVGLNNGFGIIIGKYFGAKDKHLIRQSIAGTILLNTSVTILITFLSLVFLNQLLRLMNVPSAVFADAKAYISIIVSGMLLIILYNMFSGIMRAFGNSKTPLYLIIFSTLLNVLLNYLLVIRLALGVPGAAIATVISQAASAILAGIYILKNYKEFLPTKEDFKLGNDLLKELFSAGTSMAMMISIIDIGSVIYQRAVNSLGMQIIAAHTASRRLIGMLMMPMVSISTACSTFISQNFGLKQMPRIREGYRKSLYLGWAWSILAITVVFLGGRNLVVFLTDTSDSYVIEMAFFNLMWHVVCYGFLNVLFMGRASLQAVGRRGAPLVASAIELLVKIISGFLLIPRLGYSVVWFTEPSTWIMSCLFLFYYGRRLKPFDDSRSLEV